MPRYAACRSGRWTEHSARRSARQGPVARGGSWMPMLLTVMARTTDWRAVEMVHREWLIDCARANGATHLRLYRNAKDAAQVLLLAELPDHEAVQNLVRAVGTRLGDLIVGGVPDDRLWETTVGEGLDA